MIWTLRATRNIESFKAKGDVIRHVFLKEYFVENGWVEVRVDLGRPDWRL